MHLKNDVKPSNEDQNANSQQGDEPKILRRNGGKTEDISGTCRALEFLLNNNDIIADMIRQVLKNGPRSEFR